MRDSPPSPSATIRRADLPGRRAVLLGSLGLAAGALLSKVAVASSPHYLRIAAGPVASRYFEVGSALAAAISAPPGMRGCDRDRICGVPGLIGISLSTSNTAENLRLVRSGEVDTGFCQSTLLVEAADTKTDAGPVRTIAPLFSEFVHLAVPAESSLRAASDLRGRRLAVVASPNAGSAVRATLSASGLAARELKIVIRPSAEAVEQVRTKQADALLCIESAPSAVVQALGDIVPMRLLPLEPDRMRLPGSETFGRESIPAETYDGIGPIRTLSIQVVWVAHASLDAAVAYGIARALWRPNSGLGDLLPQRSNIMMAGSLAAAPLHPGAEQFYRELGAIG